MTVEIKLGDCREVLRSMPENSVHCVVTSPPYWGLRDYGTAKWEGGDADCDHGPKAASRAERPANGLTGGKSSVDAGTVRRGDCYCGATRIDSQLGLEQTPAEYVERMVEVFREVRRVLRKDGTCWLNLGDSYANTGNKGQDFSASKVGYGGAGRGVVGGQPVKAIPIGLKQKDLVGIPWMVAFALRADGWWLRQDIIWAKPNPMPESVTDRCTKSHEYLFLLSKSERYYYDAEAIAEESVGNDNRKPYSPGQVDNRGNGHDRGGGSERTNETRDASTRNKRSVWTVTTQPFSEAHFATFPPALIEPCILASTSAEGCCSKCEAPYARLLSDRALVSEVSELDRYGTGEAGVHRKLGSAYQKQMDENPRVTVGWRATCDCIAPVMPCTVLDPFGGAGTTGLVADRHHRNAILIELNPEYAAMAKRRIQGESPLFAQVVA